MTRSKVTEVKPKRFPHKRAFEVQDTMVELILVTPGLTTDFWGAHRYLALENDCLQPSKNPLRRWA